MGAVYEAIDTRDNSRLALKVLLPHAAEEQDGLLRFKREFRALARLHHPNVVRVYDAGLENDTAYIAMELLDGRNVRKHIKAMPEGPDRVTELRRCLSQIFTALAYIHGHRIVHRDLKPENLLVCRDGRLKLMDFGVARLLRSPSSSGTLLGTFAYMAPEQVKGAEVDGRADLYAIGVLMYEMLVGEAPFPVEPPAAALHHHVNTEAPRVLDNAPDADPQLAELCQLLLQKDPQDRVQSADEALARLAPGPRPAASDFDEEGTGHLFVPRFVGRDGALEALHRLVERTIRGTGHVMLIEGASGLGKSRLIQELRSRYKKRVTVLAGACAPERLHPYQPIQAVLDDVDSVVARSAPDIVRKIVGRDGQRVQPVSPRLARRAEYAEALPDDPSERRLQLHKAVIGIIGRLALTRPVVLVIEDLHFADSGTREILWNAARTYLQIRRDGEPGTVCPVSFILTRRLLAEGQDHAEELVRRLEARGQLERVNLDPFGVDEVAFMVRSMTGVNSVAQAPLKALMHLTGGRPMLVTEVLESWIADGTLARQHGRWMYKDTSLSEAPVPSTSPVAVSSRADPTEEVVPVSDPLSAPNAEPRRPERVMSRRPVARVAHQALAESRLGSLGESARRLIERMALLGKSLPADLVRTVADLEENDFLDAVDELIRANLLFEDASRAGVRYRFRYEAFREAVVRRLPAEEKAAAHRFVARRIERRFRARRNELAHVLARHFREGGQAPRALRYLELMVDAAARRGDLGAAVRRIKEALAIVDARPWGPASNTRHLQLMLRHIDVLLDFGRAEEALERAEPTAALDARNPVRMQAEFLVRRARCLNRLGRPEQTVTTLAQMPEPPPTRSLAARALMLEGRAWALRGDYTFAQSALEGARRIAYGARLSVLCERLDGELGDILLRQGRYAEAFERLSAALDRARERHDDQACAELLGAIGQIWADQGHDDEALKFYREALQLAERRGVRADLERWSGALGALLVDMGDDGEGLAQLSRALDIAQEVGNRRGEASWRGELGRAHLMAGRHKKAAAELMRCVATARDIGFALYEGFAELYLGELALARANEDYTAAWHHLETAQDLAETLDDPELRTQVFVAMGRVAVAEGDDPQAHEWLARARASAAHSENLKLRDRVEAAVAELALHE